jgi:hypothetical protein
VTVAGGGPLFQPPRRRFHHPAERARTRIRALRDKVGLAGAGSVNIVRMPPGSASAGRAGEIHQQLRPNARRGGAPSGPSRITPSPAAASAPDGAGRAGLPRRAAAGRRVTTLLAPTTAPTDSHSGSTTTPLRAGVGLDDDRSVFRRKGPDPRGRWGVKVTGDAWRHAHSIADGQQSATRSSSAMIRSSAM